MSVWSGPGHAKPGLAKTSGSLLVSVLRSARVRVNEPNVRDLLEGADTMSEGAASRASAGATWYGTTSLLVPLEGHAPAGAHAFVASLLERDLHARLRAVRIAHREATLRAPSPLGVSHCEIHVRSDPRGVRIDVEVQAPLIERRDPALAPALPAPTAPP